MATQFFGINRGEQATAVTTGTSTTSKAVELAVNDAVSLTRKEVLDKLDQIRDFIMNQRTTPFAQ